MTMNKVINLSDVSQYVKSGMTVMIGGFANHGAPNHLVHALCDAGIKDLTVIADDPSEQNHNCDEGLTVLLQHHILKKAIMSFIGTSKLAIQQVLDGEFEMEFVPQGTLVERIHAGGAGLGGFFTPTGVGTEVAEGKETKVIDGRTYIFEKPLKADVALVKAYRADPMGNAQFLYTGSNFNLHMAMAAKTTILEVEELVNIGDIDPSFVHLPGVFVDKIVVAKEVLI